MRLEICKQGHQLDQGCREKVERQLRYILARYCTKIDRVTVRVADLGGDCGELKLHCRIVVRLVPFGQVCVEVGAVDLETALGWVAQRIGPAVSRELMRWRHRRSFTEKTATARK